MRPAPYRCPWAGVAGMLIAWCSLAFAGDAHAAGVKHLFDITGDGGAHLSLPSDVALGSEGRVYVVDGGNQRVAVFDHGGSFLFAIGREGSANGEFRNPVGIGIDGTGRVYVADTGNHRVQVFDADGGFRFAFPVVDAGLPVRPIDVAADASGEHIYVTGNNNHKVMEFTADGKLLRQWGGQGEEFGYFRYPASVALAPGGAVYVVDVLNARVQVFSGSGGRLVQVGSWGVMPGQLFRPKGVAFDRRRRTYVSDSYLDVVQVFSDEARFMHVLGQAGKPQRFVSVAGIAVGNDDRLYAAEMLANKVSVYLLEQ
jgi:tripartite motif-containing protein 71